MVMSIETTLKHPRRGFIKLEDTVAVTPTGYEIFGEAAAAGTSAAPSPEIRTGAVASNRRAAGVGEGVLQVDCLVSGSSRREVSRTTRSWSHHTGPLQIATPRTSRALAENPFVFMVVSLGAALFAPTVGHLSVFKPRVLIRFGKCLKRAETQGLPDVLSRTTERLSECSCLNNSYDAQTPEPGSRGTRDARPPTLHLSRTPIHAFSSSSP